MIFYRSLAVLAFVLAFTTSTIGQELSSKDEADLKARLNSYEEAVKAWDIETILGTLPPKIVSMQADEAGVTKEVFSAAMTDRAKQLREIVTIISHSLLWNETKVRQTSEGRMFVLIPTHTVMSMKEKKGLATNHLLSFADDGAWHLVRISDSQQAEMLVRAYPEFNGIAFPPGKMEIIEE